MPVIAVNVSEICIHPLPCWSSHQLLPFDDRRDRRIYLSHLKQHLVLGTKIFIPIWNVGGGLETVSSLLIQSVKSGTYPFGLLLTTFSGATFTIDGGLTLLGRYVCFSFGGGADTGALTLLLLWMLERELK